MADAFTFEEAAPAAPAAGDSFSFEEAKPAAAAAVPAESFSFDDAKKPAKIVLQPPAGFESWTAYDEAAREFTAGLKSDEGIREWANSRYTGIRKDGSVIARAASVVASPFTFAGNVTKGAVSDAMATATTHPDYGGNLYAMAKEEEMPEDEILRQISPNHPMAATAAKISLGVAQTAPMMVIGGLPGAAQKAIVAGFTADMINALPDTAKQLGDEMGKPEGLRDYDKITSLVSDATQQLVFGAAGAKHLEGIGRAALTDALVSRYVPRGQAFAEPPYIPRGVPPPAEAPAPEATPAAPAEPPVEAAPTPTPAPVQAPVEAPAAAAAPAPAVPAPVEIQPSERPDAGAVSTDIRPTVAQISDLIRRGPITKADVQQVLDKHYGGTIAAGKYDAKDLTDAVEMAVNKILLDERSTRSILTHPADLAVQHVKTLQKILERLPTQTTRTAEMDKLQQFSTPPPLAYVANWVAALKPSDVVLEPSAGVGGLGVFAKAAGAKVIANELSPRRADLLTQTGIADQVHMRNAEHLNALLQPEIAAGRTPQPTAVVMNPPFSNAAKTARSNTLVGAKHVEEALKLLPNGGRLVAIVGEGMGAERPAFKAWWDKIGKQYNVRANIGVEGKAFAKYGTSFGNQLVVIDKTGPTAESGTVKGAVEKVEDLVPLLERIRNERPEIGTAQPASPEPAGTAPPATGGARGGSEVAAPVEPGAPGPGGSGRGTTGPVQPAGEGAERLGQRQPAAGGSAAAPGSQPVAKRRGAGQPAERGGPGSEDAPRREPVGGLNPPAEFTQADKNVGLNVEQAVEGQRSLSEHGVFSEYSPAKIRIAGSKPHPTPLVEPTAMASVLPVDAKYSPKLPADLVHKGTLSDAQLENVVYAGQAHETMLKSGERMGYFIGDGTGVGKGRQIASIILDNWNQGRRKAVWVSKSKGLIRDAARDLNDIGFDVAKLIDFQKNRGAELGGKGEGVAFVPYSSLRSGNVGIDPQSLQAGKPKLFPHPNDGKPTRMHLLEKWLGSNFDGVIVFDEAHMAGNAIDVKGKRGVKEASAQGKMVLDVQKLFPKARVVYASATGATDITNLSYADRLGIWGEGTPFESKQKFFESITAGGLSAMEIVARDLKSMGRYLARTLSFEGVSRRQLVHELTPEQRGLYDQLAKAWQYVLDHRDTTMAQTGAAKSGKARSAANAAFYGAQQRFYNQLLTAMQMPSILSDVKAELAKGNSAVLQVVNTNEATLGREVAAKAGEAEPGDNYLEDLDLSPRDILLQYVDNSYPTTLHEPVTDENGNTRWVEVRDAKGNPVADPEAVRRKQELMDKVALVKAPQNPLEMILDTFGHENVAEVTGRSRRVVSKETKDGGTKRVLETNRGDAQRKLEAQEFQDGKRRILIFSDAGGTGFSYHASRKAKNQQRRIHYLVQSGWRADQAMQGFGRTHRSDQASAPEYALASTNIRGHQRFISTIARRLSELGALTGGERKSAGGELFSETNNLENQYAEDSITTLFKDLHNGQVQGMDFADISRRLGFTKKVIDERSGAIEETNTLIDPSTGALSANKIPTVQQFLNRILALEVDDQNRLFDEFTQRMTDRIEAAKQDGSYDPGTQTLKALEIRKLSDQVVYQHPDSTAQTRLVEVEHDQPVKLNRWDELPKGGAVLGFAKNQRSGRIYALKDGPVRTLENGQVVQTFRRIGPGSYDIVPRADLSGTHEVVPADQAQTAWEQQLAATPTKRTARDTYVVGAFLPIWDRLKIPDPKIWRVTTNAGETFLGAHVPPKMLPGLRQRLAAGAGEAADPEAVFRNVLDHGLPVDLANGWRLKRVRVGGELRIEVDGVDFRQAKLFGDERGPGQFGFMERIQFKPRFFVPTDEVEGIKTIGKILEKSPAVGSKEEIHGMATAGATQLPPKPTQSFKTSAPTRPVETSKPVPGVLEDLARLRQAAAPQTMGDEARFTANALRQLSAEMQNRLARFDKALRPYRNSFDRTPLPLNWKYDETLPLPRNLAFMDAYESGGAAEVLKQLSPEDADAATEIARQNVEMLDQVHKLGTGALKNFYENYFPHMYKNVDGAKRFLSTWLARNPLEGSKSFLKQRTHQLWRDGLAAGLLPASDNPIDMWLLKQREVSRYVLANKFIKLSHEAQIPRFVYVFERPPMEFERVDDPAFTEYAPPWVTIKEAFDEGMRSKVSEVLDKLGIPHQRLVRFRTPGQKPGDKGMWGYTASDPLKPGAERIVSKFGGPEFAIWHELGHALDSRYPDMRRTLMATPEQQHELDGLAAERYRDQDPGAKKGYFHSDAEKMAVVLQAYLHAPELFHKMAPTVAKGWDSFLEAHPELKIIDEIKPTLTLGEAQARMPVPGLTKLGEWYYPKGAAYVLNNFLRPGLQRFALYRGIREMTNLLNGIQLVGGFHLGFVAGEAPINKLALAARDASLGKLQLAGRAVLSAPIAPFLNLRRGYLLQKEALAPGSVGANYAEAVKNMEAGGFRFSQDPFWRTQFTRRTLRALSQAWTQLQQPGLEKALALSEAGKALVNLPWTAIEQVMRPVMEYFVPWQKAGAAMEMLGHDLIIHNPADEAALREVSRKVSDSIDNRMGQMAYDNAMMNRIVKDAALLSFRSFGWQLGKYREGLGGAADLAKMGWDAKSGKWTGLSHRAAYMLTLPIGVAVFGGTLNYLMTGQAPKDWRDLYMPRTGRIDANGQAVRISLPTYMKDVIAYGKHPVESLENSLNPMLSLLTDLWNNHDFYDVQIRNPDDSFVEQQLANLKYVGKETMPFFVQGMQKMGETGTPKQQQIAAFFGFMPAPARYSQTPAQALAGEIMSSGRDIVTQEQWDQKKMLKDILSKIRSGDAQHGLKELHDGLDAQALNPNTAEIMIDRLKYTPLQFQVSHLTPAAALRVWRVANAQEREQLRPIIMAKIAHAKTLWPVEQVKLAEELVGNPVSNAVPSQNPVAVTAVK